MKLDTPKLITLSVCLFLIFAIADFSIIFLFAVSPLYWIFLLPIISRQKETVPISVVVFMALFLLFAPILFPPLWSAFGFLLWPIILIPMVRKQAQRKVFVKMALFLIVIITSTIILLFATRQSVVDAFYTGLFASMYSTRPYQKIEGASWEYHENETAIKDETWRRSIVPPSLRQSCYSTNKAVCEFVDKFPTDQGLMSWVGYIQGLVFPLALALPNGMFVWYFTRSGVRPIFGE